MLDIEPITLAFFATRTARLYDQSEWESKVDGRSPWQLIMWRQKEEAETVGNWADIFLVIRHEEPPIPSSIF
jgi:hypothetical protein